MSTVQISHRCPKLPCRAKTTTRVDSHGRVETLCPACREQIVLDVPVELPAQRLITRCALCPGREFFIRKDFPQKLGLALVVLAALVASIFYARENIPATFATLAAVVVIDAVIYLFVGRVTVCYRCRAEYRGAGYNPQHEGFDLATSEKYD